ncbi:MAG: hypothetical protein ABI914_03675 [Acidobacteriota bacterium]
MQILLIVLPSLLALGSPGRAGAKTGVGVPAVLAEFDRLAARPLWPGFDPGSTPLEIFDGERTWLVRHPRPPAGFLPARGRSDAVVVSGRHGTVRANTSVAVGGVATATASFEGLAGNDRRLAALLLHEAFHVFQARRHPKWGGNEAELFVYPVENPETLALRRIESLAFARALESTNPGGRASWAGRAIEARRARFARLPPGAAEFERGTELKEGLARYIEVLAVHESAPLFSEAEFAADRVRVRAYASGAAMALLLDVLDPAWKPELEQRDEPLDVILGRAVAGVPGAALSGEEEASIRSRAKRDVAAWAESRASLRNTFLSEAGWTLVLECNSPLFPQGFDPLNVERLSEGSVLHTRWLKLGNAEGTFEVLGRRCLTEAAGKHPLFEGVRRVSVAGLPEEPRTDVGEGEGEGGLRVTAPGLTLAFRNARISRNGRTVTVTLGGGSPPPLAPR